MRVSGVRRSCETAASMLGALADVAQDALAHQVERRAGLADLGRALELEVADVAALAEIVGGPGEAPDRPQLPGHEVDRHDQQQQRQPDHPAHEHLGGARCRPACAAPAPAAARRPSGRRPRSAWASRTCRVSITNGRSSSPAKVSVRRAIEPARRDQPGRLHRRRQRAAGLERDRDAEMLARELEHLAARGGGLGRVQQVDDQAHLAGEADRQPAGHRVPMALVENVGQDRLQDQQRHDHDQQGAAEQAARPQPARRKLVRPQLAGPEPAQPDLDARRRRLPSRQAGEHSLRHAWSRDSAARAAPARACAAAARSGCRPRAPSR